MGSIKNLRQRADRLDLIICGSADASEYNPYIAFQNRIRKGILIGLHEAYSIVDVSKALNVSRREVLNHLKFLRNAEFIVKKNEHEVPSFFVALREDVLRAKKASKRLGEEIAKCYIARWDIVMETYHKLSISSKFGFDRVGFVLIGAYSLDMIDRFAEEGKLCRRLRKGRPAIFICGLSKMVWKLLVGMECIAVSLANMGLQLLEVKEKGEEHLHPTIGPKF